MPSRHFSRLFGIAGRALVTFGALVNEIRRHADDGDDREDDEAVDERQ
jgi:hypothetical protein